jgi:hypothetical protein
MADFDSFELVYMRAEDRGLVIGPAIVRASSLILLWRAQTPSFRAGISEPNR